MPECRFRPSVLRFIMQVTEEDGVSGGGRKVRFVELTTGTLELHVGWCIEDHEWPMDQVMMGPP